MNYTDAGICQNAAKVHSRPRFHCLHLYPNKALMKNSPVINISTLQDLGKSMLMPGNLWNASKIRCRWVARQMDGNVRKQVW